MLQRTIFGKAASVRGVVVDWREVDTVAPRYCSTVLDSNQFMKLDETTCLFTRIETL